MNDLLLDTHTWFWHVSGDMTLKVRARNIINAAAQEGRLFLSAISTWEVAMLEAKGRIHLTMPTLQWIEAALDKFPTRLIYLSPKITVESCQLLDMHGDPADRLIVATARVENLTLLTRDNKIQKYAKTKQLRTISV